MSFSGIVSSFCLLITFCFALKCVFGIDQPLEQLCHIAHNFTANSTFETNLNRFMASLPYTAPPTGFYHGSVGQRPNQVFGLALCRADISRKDCQSCVFNAAAEIRKGCPVGKRALLWTDSSCFLKYSFENFFGRIDDDITIGSGGPLPNVTDPSSGLKINQFLSNLLKEASTNSQLFKARKLRMGALKFYGLAQCTRDLSGSSCKKCLSDMGFNGTEVGYLVNGSCLIRFENYPF